MHNLSTRVISKSRRLLANHFGTQQIAIRHRRGMISFTFDDAPKSAFGIARDMLEAHSARATYYVSLRLAGTCTEVGPIGTLDDMSRALADGHELGCHTFDHLDAWHVPTGAFVQSVDRNEEALKRLLPGARFSSFAYPKSGATLAAKLALRKRFVCARGGGQIANVGRTDANLLKACFLDRRTGIDMSAVRTLIDRNAEQRGWLILATHDVGEEPTPYGCNTRFFEAVVRYSAKSGAELLPVSFAISSLRSTQ